MGRGRLGVTLLLGAGAIAAAVLGIDDSEVLGALCREDGPFEYLTAILYLVTCGLFVITGLQRPRQPLWYWGYALLFFLIAGEEVSWGQRIFDVATPEGLNQVNVQGELNLHNVDGVHQNIRAVACVVILGICYVLPALHVLGIGIVAMALAVLVARHSLGAILGMAPSAAVAEREAEDVPAVAVAPPDVAKASPALQRLQQAMTVEHAYRREGLSVATLAADLGIGEAALRVLINQQLGYRNFNDFLHAYRIREACERLRSAEDARLPVLSIALDVGYGSIGPFNRAFKSRIGMTPTRFRQQARN